MVTDNGPGIRWEEKDLIFNRFYRGILDKADDEDEENKGTGLGLALTREIIEQHGGNISVESLPNERTSFTFTLPTQGLVSPQRGITAWNPGDENFDIELANRLAEGKTVGVLTGFDDYGALKKENPDAILDSIARLGEAIDYSY